MAKQNVKTKEAGVESGNEKQLIISRTFDAPRELVWEAWTDPRLIAQWWGPTGFTTTIETMDVRPGGTWSQVMHGPDGTDYPSKSVFREVVKPERIAFTHGGGRKGDTGVNFESVWTFEALAEDKTRVTICMEFSTAADLEKVVREYGAAEGGKQTLARLGSHLAQAPVVIERVFSAPAEAVWKALTNKDQINQWSFGIKEFKPEKGFEFEFTAEKDGVKYIHLCKITEAVRNRKLAYTWRYKGYEGCSLVTIELFPESGKTRLRLTHSGLETLLPEKFPDFVRTNFFKGWTHIIGTSLQSFVDNAGSAGSHEFVISRTFDAPRALVFKAWTDPKLMVKWWGPEHFTNPVCKMDVRKGGTYRIVMRAPDGTDHPCIGIFKEVTPPERLVMAMDHSELPEEWHDKVNPGRKPDEKLILDIAVTFEEAGGKTTLTVRVAFKSAAMRDAFLKIGMKEGWSGSLDKLTKLF